MRIVRQGPADLTLFTPTRDRPLAFSFCERWMARQTYSGTVLWIVVDDGDVQIRPTMGQLHIRRQPSPRRSTLPENVLAAIPFATGLGVVVAEDDDWYHSDYVAEMAKRLPGVDIVGIANALYYHVPTRRYQRNDNQDHASFCSTAVGIPTGLDHMANAAGRLMGTDNPLVDMDLWSKKRKMRRYMFNGNRLVVGLKGWPGRKNLCPSSVLGPSHPHDRDGYILRRWIGPEDAAEVLAAFA